MTLRQFIDAHSTACPGAVAELRAGHKTSRCIWLILSKPAVLGRSKAVRLYGNADLAQARACLARPLRASRLIRCADTLLSHPTLTASAILPA